VTSPGDRQQKLVALSLAIRRTEYLRTTWVNQQLRARTARIHHELTAAITPPAPAADRQIEDREAEP
jgi:hypothetical protein